MFGADLGVSGTVAGDATGTVLFEDAAGVRADVTSEEPKKEKTPRDITCAIDVHGWAFDHIARRIAGFFPNDNVDIVPYEELQNQTGDLVICLWWRALERVMTENRFRRSILCLYDHYSWPKTPQDQFTLSCAIKRADVIAVGNQQIEQMLRNRGLATRPVFITEDGVDCDLFQPLFQLPPIMVLGWCGNARAARGGLKGLELIEEACRLEGVELRTLDVSAGQGRPYEDMPEWYNSLSAYVCASTAEGTPNPVLESMACGRPVITTRCGLTPRIVQDGVSGVFVDRTVEDIRAGIDRLKRTDVNLMGRSARRSALAHDWSHKLPAWRAAIEAAMEKYL